MKLPAFFKKKECKKETLVAAEKEPWENPYDTVRRMGIAGYQARYFDQCKEIWKAKVPASGQADTLQGEMLRQVEKLCYEACDNGNINWDGDFAWFCDFLLESFTNSGTFDSVYLEKLTAVLAVIKRCGEYAADFNAGKIPEEQAEPDRMAYTEEDIYDFLRDSVALVSQKNPQDIPYQKKDFIHR
ncbi:MAG: hypothetical protein Q4G00_02620 [Clostridia bacterium]|nr:hypothetical protein [Clostridia bacterium]